MNVITIQTVKPYGITTHLRSTEWGKILVTDIKSGSTLGLFGFFRPNKSKIVAVFNAFLDRCAKKSKQSGAGIFDLIYLGWVSAPTSQSRESPQ